LIDILGYLPKVLERNQFIMGPMLETLCLYTQTHKSWQQAEIMILLQIAQLSLTHHAEAQPSYAGEGCLLLQCVLLNIQEKQLVPLISQMQLKTVSPTIERSISQVA